MRLLILILLTAILAGPPEAESCGPFLSRAEFSFVERPPETAFAAGKIGILRPTYYRRYLVVAYRYLNGVPLNQGEIAAFGPRQSILVAADQVPLSPTEQWVQARGKVPGTAPLNAFTLDRFRQPRAQEFDSYANCLDDAFSRAVQTLNARVAAWGVDSSLTKEWLRGEDMVFRDCSQGEEIPPALPSDANALLAADRQYQIAAAQFYSEKYDEAADSFGIIARNANSPWQDLGELMVARTLIREATVGKDPDKLADAQAALERILANPKLRKWSNTATGLRDYVTAIRDPDKAIQQLSNKLIRPESGPDFADALYNFTFLWDRRENTPPAGTALIDWIATFKAHAWKRALDQWRAKRDEAWLIAALSSVPHDDPAVPELLDAAHRVSSKSPAWASVSYYGISLQLARGENEAALKWLDESLAAKAPHDVNNEFLAQRLSLASNWEEFMRYGARVPVAEGGDFTDLPLDGANPAAVFDIDFTAPFNEDVPLKLWINAASNPLLPGSLQAEIAQAGWTRAVLLDQIPEARSLAARWAKLRPPIGIELHAWLNDKDAASARFEAVWLLLHKPGLQPELRDNWGRATPIGKIDDLRDNWWRLGGSAPRLRVPLGLKTGPRNFLSESDRTAGQTEWGRLLESAPMGAAFLCQQVVTWALAHPDDPRVPEALHLAVRTTRYTNDQNGSSFPKRAFELLHRRYPQSKWTILTPYWY
jgi:hypothetical protein